jgi:flagellar M-ring protein FliF
MAFETSRSVRQVKMPRGNIKRISTAVLLDQDFVWQGQGAQRKHVLTAPTPERIKAIHDVVAGVLGIQADRGDLVVIESLPFEQTLAEEESANSAAAKPGKATPQTPLAKLLADRRVQIGCGLAILLLILAAVFLVGRKTKSKVELEQAGALPAGSEGAKLEGAGSEGTGGAKQIDGAADGASPAVPAPKTRLALPEMDSATKIMLTQIQEHVAKDPAFAAGVIRGWMEEE